MKVFVLQFASFLLNADEIVHGTKKLNYNIAVCFFRLIPA